MTVTVDSFMLPGYNVQDALPAQLANETASEVKEYQIPLVVWMFLFLIAGYIGIRMILED